MEHIFIETNDEEFIFHFEMDGIWINGNAYPIIRYMDSKEKEDYKYVLNQDNSPVDKLSDECRCFYSFKFCWRGVWEGRIYFEDDEYWSEELKTIYESWQLAENKFKEILRKKNPHIYE